MNVRDSLNTELDIKQEVYINNALVTGQAILQHHFKNKMIKASRKHVRAIYTPLNPTFI